MKENLDLKEVDVRIQAIKRMAEELHRQGDEFPALARNADRILASLKMLEINISDAVLVLSDDH